jgi:Spy/CpxP family protein refolding chaperone
MNPCSRWLSAALIVVLAAPAVQAQRGQRGPGGGFGRVTSLFLLTQKSVQQELKLSDEQIKKLTELADKQRQTLAELGNLAREERQQKMREQTQAADKAVAEILQPEQQKLLKQIVLQQRGAQALSEPEVADALGLSAEQKEKLKTIRDEAQREMRELFQGGNREEAQKKVADLRKATEEKAQEVLTPEQKTKWKEMVGEPFKGEIARPAGLGGRRPGRANPPAPR